jgi:protein FRA10AC1
MNPRITGNGSTYFSMPIASSASKLFNKHVKMDPLEKHKSLITNYNTYYSAHQIKNTTIADILAKNNKFIRDDDEESREISWDERVAKKYYDKLFKVRQFIN